MKTSARLLVVGVLLAVATCQTPQVVFLGKHGGNWACPGWACTSPVNLIVEGVVRSGWAWGIYLWGANANGVRFKGKFEDGTLVIPDPEKAVGFKFTMRPDGKLYGERIDRGRTEDSDEVAR